MAGGWAGWLGSPKNGSLSHSTAACAAWHGPFGIPSMEGWAQVTIYGVNIPPICHKSDRNTHFLTSLLVAKGRRSVGNCMLGYTIFLVILKAGGNGGRCWQSNAVVSDMLCSLLTSFLFIYCYYCYLLVLSNSVKALFKCVLISKCGRLRPAPGNLFLNKAFRKVCITNSP